ncbi:non-ribosomal peptide synthetase [Fluviicola sp.]|uniref:non-ribosomal peptide synthetase n=1 Tax=Fluviicola sp. TaxID=1917219 RepID=UPI00260FAE80|nr:non-ribosomal peptide synthetase [Fluviicola sp.]
MSKKNNPVSIEQRIRNLNRENLSELEAASRKWLDSGVTGKIPKRLQKETAPLSYSQERLWLAQQMVLQSPIYNLSFVMHFQELNMPVFKRAVYELTRRHEALRTTIQLRHGKPMQIITPSVHPRITIDDLRHFLPEKRHAELNNQISKASNAPIDLTTGPLFKIHIIRLQDSEYCVHCVIHHIISDGWTLELLSSEIRALYEAYEEKRSVDLPPVPVQYGDFAEWQRNNLADGSLAEQVSFWKKELEGVPQVVTFPNTGSRPEILGFSGESQYFHISKKTIERLNSLCREENGSLFSALLSAYALLVANYTNEHDLVIGTPVSNRTFSEVENLVGYFVNTLLIRTQMDMKQDFKSLFRNVQQKVLNAQDNQEIPFEKILEELHIERTSDHHPLFQLVFSLEQSVAGGYSGGLADLNVHLNADGRKNKSFVVDKLQPGTSKFDMTMILHENDDTVTGVCEYNTDIFSSGFISVFLHHFLQLLDAIAEHPDVPVSELAFHSHGELLFLEKLAVEAEFELTDADLENMPQVISKKQLFGNQVAYVVDQYENLLPINVRGQLWMGEISGKASDVELRPVGYEALISETGKIRVLGNVDRFVKLKGRFLNLDTLEKALNQVEGIIAASVSLDEQKVLAVIDGTEAHSELAKRIRVQLRENYYWLMSDLYLSSLNAEVSENGLAKMVPVHADRSLPLTPMEVTLSAIWKEVLDVKKIYREDHFFDLGGNSMTAFQVLNRIQKYFDLSIEINQLFTYPSLQEFSAFLETYQEEVLNSEPTNSTNPIEADDWLEKLVSQEEFPLSYGQENLWYLYQLNPESPIYNVPLVVPFGQLVSPESMQRALTFVVERHPMLRSRFFSDSGRPVQVVTDSKDFSLELINLKDNEEAVKKANEIISEASSRGFDLENGPVLHTMLLQFGNSYSWLFVNMHHLLSDGKSHDLLIREIKHVYEAMTVGSIPELAGINMQYADFALEQRKRLTGDHLEKLLRFWKKELKGVHPLLQLPESKIRPQKPSYQGNSISFVLPEDLTKKIRHFSQESGVTVFMSMLTVFKVLLYRYSKQQDIVVGIPVSNRSHTELERVVGYFVNTTVIRTKIQPNTTFKTLLKNTKRNLLNVFAHQEMPIEMLISELKPERSAAYHPLFQVMFSHQELHDSQQKDSDEGVTKESFSNKTSKFDLSMSVGESSNQIQGTLEYSTDIFELEMMHEFVENYVCLARAFFANPALKLQNDQFQTIYQEKSPASDVSVIGGIRLNRKRITNYLHGLEGVKDVFVHEYKDSGRSKLLACMVLHRNTELESILDQIKLPDYMTPATIIAIDALPMKKDGMVDTKRLSTIVKAKQQHSTYVPPVTDTHHNLVELWKEVLEKQRIGIRDNFFDLGGASLIAMQLLSRVRQLYGIEIPVGYFLDHPTIEELSLYIDSYLVNDSAEQKSKRLPPLVVVQNKERIPLSYMQERLWFLDQFEPGTSFYNVITICRFDEIPEKFLLEQAISDVISQQEALRTTFTFHNDRPFQVIHEPGEVVLEVEDLREVADPVQRDTIIARLCQLELTKPFDLESGPLFRYKAIIAGENQYLLVLTMHHIISDAWSLNLLNTLIQERYHSHVRGSISPMNPLSIQYPDFAIWQRRLLRGSRLESLENYWRENLKNLPSLLELPISKRRPQYQIFAGSAVKVDLSPEIVRDLREIGKEHHTTLFTVMLAAYNVLLFRYTDRTDLPVGIPAANRNRPELEELIGFFTNTLVVRSQFHETDSFENLLDAVKKTWNAAQEHNEMPFEKLVELIQPQRNTSFNPLFQIMFSFHNVGLTEIDEQETATSNEIISDVEHSISKFDLTLHAIEGKKGMQLIAEYNTDLFENTSIKRFLSHFVNLLSAISEDPKKGIHNLNMLDSEEYSQVVHTWNETAEEKTKFACIHHFFEDAVGRFPDQIAVAYHDTEWTYKKLDQAANQWARLLRSHGVGRGIRVAVCHDPSPELMMLTLAVFKAGGVIVPLDKKYPIQRLCYMLEDSNAQVLLADQFVAPQFEAWEGKLIVVSEEELSPASGYSLEKPEEYSTAEDLIYVLYTSGSTGKPKGVPMQHKAVCNLIEWQIQASGNRVLPTMQFSPTSFDVSFQELFSTWAVGATLVMLDIEEKGDPFKCLELLEKHAVERMFLPFVALDQLANAVKISGIYPPLKQLITAGEQLRMTPEIKHWVSNTKGCVLENQYGPVETHIVTSHFLESREQLDEALPPIGKPLMNNTIYILDKYDQPVGVGLVGELCIGGEQVATGYHNQPEKTDEKFVVDPFAADGTKMYKTGDKARFQENGDIEFIGRIDNQVKIRGFRIEPGEIESVLTTHDDIREAVVVFYGDNSAERMLVCYIITANGLEELPDLKKFLAEYLPEYMIPSRFILLTELPKTPSGKIDRLLLSGLPLPQLQNDDEDALSKTPLEQKLAELWKEILGVSAVGIHDNFFDLGGHSLLATRLVSRILDEFGVRLPVKIIFEAPELEKMAVEIVVYQAVNLSNAEELITKIESM